MDLPLDFKELLAEFASSKVEALGDLIANKRAAGRAQDLLDAAYLERVRDKAR